MKIIQRTDTGCEHKKEIQSEKWLLEKYISLQETHPHPILTPLPSPPQHYSAVTRSYNAEKEKI